MTQIFTESPALWPHQKRLADENFESSKNSFESRQAHDAFFSYLITPKSGRWAFASPGKTATSSALDFLFTLEFGHGNSVFLKDPTDLNQDPQTHRCVNCGVFRRLPHRSDIISYHDYLQNSFRIATVRHPATRLWSAFRYLCRSNREGHPMFMGDRIKMCAVVGFDWNSHPDTKEGLIRFLDYIQYIQKQTAGLGIDNHWRPQWMVIRPDYYKPNLIGRFEEPNQFAKDLIEMLDGDPEFVPLRRNQSEGGESELPSYLADPEIQKPLTDIYKEDFQAFGYDW